MKNNFFMIAIIIILAIALLISTSLLFFKKDEVVENNRDELTNTQIRNIKDDVEKHYGITIVDYDYKILHVLDKPVYIFKFLVISSYDYDTCYMDLLVSVEGDDIDTEEIYNFYIN